MHVSFANNNNYTGDEVCLSDRARQVAGEGAVVAICFTAAKTTVDISMWSLFVQLVVICEELYASLVTGRGLAAER